MSYYLTEEGLDEIKKELEHLKREARAEIAERLRRAKEYGDLSENSEYIDAKDEQSRLEGRIFELEEILRDIVIIKKSKNAITVKIGCTIDVEKNGKTMRYTIVGREEADPGANLISNESPLGRAFLGKKVGDAVEVETPGGKIKYRIKKIE